jgi:cobalt-zinc-cadmium efflux system outer membrane protein
MSGSLVMETNSPTRRVPLKESNGLAIALAIFGLLMVAPAGRCQSVTVNLDRAIEMALHHNHTLLAARTTIQQSQAQEITANLRPNPSLFADWEYLPIFSKPEGGVASYLQGSTEGDIGVSNTFERGNKRAHRLQAARDATAVARSQLADNERGVAYQVATLFINAQLAQSTLELTQQNLRSFQNTVDIAESQFKGGGISENDYLKVKLQLLQFQTDDQQARLAKVQALSDLRQQLGYESVPADYDVVGPFEYRPLLLTLPELETAAMQNRPDFRAAQQGVTAAGSQYALAKANGKQDLTLSANYSHVNGMSASSFALNIPIAIFDRNQGEIARTNYAITQAREQEFAARGQVRTDVKDAYENLLTSERVVRFYESGYLEISRRNREISEYAYGRGATTLLDFLDAERTYRSTQLGYRQAIAAYLQALEQVRQAIGSRSLP